MSALLSILATPLTMMSSLPKSVAGRLAGRWAGLELQCRAMTTPDIRMVPALPEHVDVWMAMREEHV